MKTPKPKTVRAEVNKLLKKVDALMGKRNRTKFVNRCVIQSGPAVLREVAKKHQKTMQNMKRLRLPMLFYTLLLLQ